MATRQSKSVGAQDVLIAQLAESNKWRGDMRYGVGLAQSGGRKETAVNRRVEQTK